ncbi:MAG: type III-A CRISPR-associated protein Csm2 [Thermodesulfobacteriota bacterium]
MAYEIKEVLEELKKLVSMKELDASKFCEENGYADSLAQKFGKDELKPTQLRKVFHALKDIQRGLKSQPFDRTKVMKLLPEIAYASGRGLIPKTFYDLMKICLSKEKLKDKNDFEKVMDLLTSILAYHKMRHA